jgi:Type IV secretion system pilin
MKKVLWIFAVGFLLLSAGRFAMGTVVTPPLGGDLPLHTPENPAAIVSTIYNIALMAGGVLAFGAIVFGAIRYTVAAGNPTGQHEARDQITQALLGLLLLFGCYLILKTINPQLVGNLNLPVLDPIHINPNDNQIAAGAIFTCGEPNGGGTCAPSGALGTYLNSSCFADIKSKLKPLNEGVNFFSWGPQAGAHNANSCHFGGVACAVQGSPSYGGHAFDIGTAAINYLNYDNTDALVTALVACGNNGNPTNCHCELEGGSGSVPCSGAGATHIHCDVNASMCGGLCR